VRVTESDRRDELEREVARLCAGIFEPSSPQVVHVPPELCSLFDKVAGTIRALFAKAEIDPARARIAIDDERYLLIRASAFSIDFLDALVQLYADRGERDALAIARGFLFDIAHTIGLKDAPTIHDKLGSKEPLEKLTGGPVLFAYTGWAQVKILPSSNPVPDDTFCLVYEHPYSFEAQSFLDAGRVSAGPVCIMNAGYSSGWCQASFGIELTSVEVTCKARGDAACCFVMAPPHLVNARVREHFAVDLEGLVAGGFDVPMYFERKRAEEEVRRSLARLEAAQAELVRRERMATVGLLVSSVAHEVNTPLGVAVTASGVVSESLATLRGKFERNELTRTDLRAFLDRAGAADKMVADNLQRAAHLITRFKQVSVDQATHELRLVDLASYVTETLASLRTIARRGNLEVSVVTEGDLECMTHPGAIAQILTNFLTNTALHATTPGTPLAVDVRVTRVALDRVTLVYADAGAGMSEEIQAQVFQPFFTTNRGGGGSGLGLHIVQSLVTDVLDGMIALDSSPGGGTRFTISFRVTTASRNS
jgi:signal transduction histidine kinase/predicted hydrocarbon binding protein